MENNLYKTFREMIKTRNKYIELENKNASDRFKREMFKINRQIDDFVDLIRSMIEIQEKIIDKRVSTALKIQELNIITPNSCCLHLPYTCHEEFRNILQNTIKLTELILNKSVTKHNSEQLRTIVNKIEELHSYWHDKTTDKLNKYLFAKSFLENMRKLRKLNTQNDSEDDLGCAPFDSSSENNENHLENLSINTQLASFSQLVSSSPISTSK